MHLTSMTQLCAPNLIGGVWLVVRGRSKQTSITPDPFSFCIAVIFISRSEFGRNLRDVRQLLDFLKQTKSGTDTYGIRLLTVLAFG
jgi:hypothetical protein